MPRTIRPLRVEGNVAYIPLTKGYEAIIDASDVSLVDRWNWRAIVAPYNIYVGRKERRNGRQVAIYLHREITQAPSGKDVDHANGDGLDNRRGNLRIASRAQNMWNTGATSRSRTGLKGVTVARGRFVALITANKKLYRLGSFDTPEAAHAAYCRASAELHGNFGRAK